MSSDAEPSGGRDERREPDGRANAADGMSAPRRAGAESTAGAGRARISAAQAASVAVAAADGGGEVVIVAVVDSPSERIETLLGRRILVDAADAVRGTLGDPALDAEAVRFARRMSGAAMPGTVDVELDGGTYTLYAEAHRPPDELVVVGAGHIAVPLAALGVTLGFRTTVLDDREDFATAERFTEGARVIRADFTDPFREVPIGPRTYLVLVTRAHKYDFDCLRDLVERDVRPAYIGMIGSRRRVRAAFRSLLDAGVPRDRLDRVYAPVGLDIGAETPEEIAVSIAAELVRVRRVGTDAAPSAGSVAHGEATGADAPASEAAADATPTAGTAPPGRREATTLSEKERVLERLLPERRE